MAGELRRERIYLRLLKSGEKAEFEALTQFLTVTGTEYIYNVQSVGTTKEDLDKGDITTIGYVAMENLGATNYCSFGDDGDNPSIELKVGESCLVRWARAVANVSAKADTAAVRIRYIMIED